MTRLTSCGFPRDKAKSAAARHTKLGHISVVSIVDNLFTQDAPYVVLVVGFHLITGLIIKITISTNLIGSFNILFFLNLTVKSFIGEFSNNKMLLLDTCHRAVE